MIEDGTKVKIHYTLSVDGRVVDSTVEREPFEYTQGKGQILSGLERQIQNLNKDDEREIVVGPEDAYGVVDPEAFLEVPKSKLPKGDMPLGTFLQVTTPDGTSMLAMIHEIKDDSVLLNFNHPLAGKELHFWIRIVQIG